MKKIISTIFVSLLFSVSSFASENCDLSMKLKLDFYYIQSPNVLPVDHVHIVATVVQDKTYPAYHTLLPQEQYDQGIEAPKHDLANLKQISFNLPNVPGMIYELDKAMREGYVLWINFNWLSDNCASFKDFEFSQNSYNTHLYANFKYKPESMYYKLHAMQESK